MASFEVRWVVASAHWTPSRPVLVLGTAVMDAETLLTQTQMGEE